ncbi:MAG: hypothetical protein ACI9YL_001732 [Luteibaculaceae bacterium]
MNFNYSNTLEKMRILDRIGDNDVILNIHGSVNDKKYPIILGYGDDTHERYKEVEQSGEDEFLRFIKSFRYQRSDVYRNLINIMSENHFDVFTLGHSCGLSDRTLLKTIFEHKHCSTISRFYYKGEDEDFYRRMAISRHFDDKLLMRERLLPFDFGLEIPQMEQVN